MCSSSSAIHVCFICRIKRLLRTAFNSSPRSKACATVLDTDDSTVGARRAWNILKSKPSHGTWPVTCLNKFMLRVFRVTCWWSWCCSECWNRRQMQFWRRTGFAMMASKEHWLVGLCSTEHQSTASVHWTSEGSWWPARSCAECPGFGLDGVAC